MVIKYHKKMGNNPLNPTELDKYIKRILDLPEDQYREILLETSSTRPLEWIPMEGLYRPDRDAYFMDKARKAAIRSTCLSRPVGAVIVSPDHYIVSTGYNGAPSGMRQCLKDKKSVDYPDECYRRINKLRKDDEPHSTCRSCHAEANALAMAAKKGIPVEDCTVYVTLESCLNCMKQMKQSGIVREVYETAYESENPERDRMWREYAEESGIVFVQKILTKEERRYINAFALAKEISARRLKKTG
jgi:dCMP deaminase